MIELAGAHRKGLRPCRVGNRVFIRGEDFSRFLAEHASDATRGPPSQRSRSNSTMGLAKDEQG